LPFLQACVSSLQAAVSKISAVRSRKNKSNWKWCRKVNWLTF
jgi:hypothetical protein